MAKKKGTPNNAAFGKPGQIKDNLIKFRVSQQWLDIVEEAIEQIPFWYNGKSRSDIYRLAILEAIQRNAYDNEALKEKIQEQIAHT